MHASSELLLGCRSLSTSWRTLLYSTHSHSWLVIYSLGTTQGRKKFTHSRWISKAKSLKNQINTLQIDKIVHKICFLLFRGRLKFGCCSKTVLWLMWSSGKHVDPNMNLFVEKLVNEALSLRPFICHLGFQFPITVHQPSLGMCFKCITVTYSRHNLLRA